MRNLLSIKPNIKAICKKENNAPFLNNFLKNVIIPHKI